MASTGTRNTMIAFGDYELAVSMKKCEHPRDLKTEYVDATGKKVTASRGGNGGAGAGLSKAVRLADESIIRLPADELEAIVEESKDAWGKMQVLETIDYRQVPTERIKGSYWLQPRAGTGKAFKLLACGLQDTARVAVVKWVSQNREKLGVIRVRYMPAGPSVALLLSEISFANDFAGPDEDALAHNEIEVSEEAVAAASRLVKSFARRGVHVVDEASDEAVDRRLALLERLQDEKLEHELSGSAEPVPASG